MASTRGNMKGFYRQKKKDSGISKPSAKNNRKSPPNKAAAFASDPAQLAALISTDLKDDKHEDVLRQFDLNMAYGPCLGMTRLARWERANRLGLNPPADIEPLLKNGKVQAECVWNGRV